VKNLQNNECYAKAVMANSASLREALPDLVRGGSLGPDYSLPLVIGPTDATVGLIQWAHDNRALLDSTLLRKGAILFRGFDLRTAEEFERLIEAVSGTLLDYSYKSTPRTQVSGHIYTSTEYPAHQSIPLHNENSYSRHWPAKLWFFSMRVAAQGGETPLADSRKVYQLIPAEIRECFERKGLRYVRNFGTGLDLPWQDVFQTNSRAAVEDYCRKTGINFDWIGAEQLRTSQCCQVSARHPQTREMVWFNQAHLFHISRLPIEVRDCLLATFAAEDLPRNVYFGDGSTIDAQMLDEILQVYKELTVTFGWRVGDVLLIDNMLTAHGRNPFSGKRKVVVGMS
jgi:alpha-ketoglutarate-dependent taurine dioxygenase